MVVSGDQGELWRRKGERDRLSREVEMKRKEVADLGAVVARLEREEERERQAVENDRIKLRGVV